MNKSILKMIMIIMLLINSASICFTSELTEEKSQNDIIDKSLSSIGWAIGAAIAPIYIGIEYTGDILEWSGENIIEPIGDGIGWTIEKTADGVTVCSRYTIVPIVKGIFWSGEQVWDYVIFPVAKTAGYGIKYGYEYIFVPTVNGLVQVVDTTADVVSFTAKYTIIPVGKGIYKATEYGTEFIIIPIGNGMIDGVRYVAVPIGKGVRFGAEYTIVPVAKGVKYSAEKVGSGLTWSAENVIYPISLKVGQGVEKVAKPVNNSIKKTAESIKFFIKRNK